MSSELWNFARSGALRSQAGFRAAAQRTEPGLAVYWRMGLRERRWRATILPRAMAHSAAARCESRRARRWTRSARRCRLSWTHPRRSCSSGRTKMAARSRRASVHCPRTGRCSSARWAVAIGRGNHKRSCGGQRQCAARVLSAGRGVCGRRHLSSSHARRSSRIGPGARTCPCRPGASRRPLDDLWDVSQGTTVIRHVGVPRRFAADECLRRQQSASNRATASSPMDILPASRISSNGARRSFVRFTGDAPRVAADDGGGRRSARVHGDAALRAIDVLRPFTLRSRRSGRARIPISTIR